MGQRLGLGLGYGAGAGADALTNLLARRFFEMMQQQRFEEDRRQFDTRHGEDVRQFDTTFGQRQKEFGVTSEQAERRLSQEDRSQKFDERKWAEEAPQRLLDLGYTKERINELRRAPKEAELKRTHDIKLEDLRTVGDLKIEDRRGQWGLREAALRVAASGAGKDDPDPTAIFNEIEGLSNRINTGGPGIATTVTGLARRGAAKLNLDNDVAEYQALVKGFVPMIARAVGHSGVLTQLDVDSVRGMFPLPQDNKELARNKLARVRRLMAGDPDEVAKLRALLSSGRSTGTAGGTAAAGGNDPAGIRRRR